MNPLLHALTLLLLLRCGDVKLPPLCQRWSSVSLDELFDTHLVLCLKFEQDVAAAWTFHAIRFVYDWASLGRALPLLKEMWFRYVKQNVPLPTAVLAAGDRLNKRLRGSVFANFPDEQLSLPWPMQCEAAVESLHVAMEDDSAASSAAPRTPVGRPMFSVNVLDSPDLRSLQPMLEIESSPEPPPKRARHSESTSDSKDWVWHCMKKLNIM